MNEKTSRATHCASADGIKMIRSREDLTPAGRLMEDVILPGFYKSRFYKPMKSSAVEPSPSDEATAPPEAKAMKEALERCDREISDAAGQHDKPAYLVTLGIEDWECEKRLIKAGA